MVRYTRYGLMVAVVLFTALAFPYSATSQDIEVVRVIGLWPDDEFEGVVDHFQNNNEYEVEYTQVPYEALLDTVLNGVMAGVPPDIAQVPHLYWMAVWAHEGWLTPLGNFAIDVEDYQYWDSYGAYLSDWYALPVSVYPMSIPWLNVNFGEQTPPAWVSSAIVRNILIQQNQDGARLVEELAGVDEDLLEQYLGWELEAPSALRWDAEVMYDAYDEYVTLVDNYGEENVLEELSNSYNWSELPVLVSGEYVVVFDVEQDQPHAGTVAFIEYLASVEGTAQWVASGLGETPNQDEESVSVLNGAAISLYTYELLPPDDFSSLRNLEYDGIQGLIAGSFPVEELLSDMQSLVEEIYYAGREDEAFLPTSPKLVHAGPLFVDVPFASEQRLLNPFICFRVERRCGLWPCGYWYCL